MVVKTKQVSYFRIYIISMDYSIKNYNGAPNNTIVLPDHAPKLRSCIAFQTCD